MKKITFILIALITFSVSAQKKKNGTVYVDHPGIQLVNDFNIEKAKTLYPDSSIEFSTPSSS